MFLYDNSSTHGTFLNKRRIKSKVYAPVRVGDVIKFGQSTRLYIVQGPPELMPEEGPSKQQRQEMMVLAAQADRKERDAQVQHGLAMFSKFFLSPSRSRKEGNVGGGCG